MGSVIGEAIGPYRVLEELGSGGMGVVYKVHDPLRQRHAALKVLRADAASAENRRRFLREANLSSRITHPNVVSVFEVGSEQGIDYILMEYVEGQPLTEYLGASEVRWSKGLELGVQIASGLLAAHTADVVHRDLKPSNILVDHAGRPKILDFGLAKLLLNSSLDTEITQSTPLTRFGEVLGTIAYMSPEQARGEPLDHRSDIFSFGVLLYEMLTGRPPFQGPNAVSLLTAVQLDAPQSIRATHPDIPPKLEQIVFRALAKRVQARFQTMAEMLALMQEVTPNSSTADLSVHPALADLTEWNGQVKKSFASPSVALGPYVLPPAAGTERTSLAVLPLSSLSSNPEDDYVAAGLSEELTRGLAGVPGLRVAPQLASFRLQASNLGDIALALNIRYVLSGSFRRFGNRMRVAVQLTDALQEALLWSRNYDREFLDIFAVQDEISQAIVRSIGGELIRAEVNSFSRALPESLDAWGLTRKAYHIWNYSFSLAGVHEAVSLLRRAIVLDPHYAVAHAYLGLYLMQAAIHCITPWDDATAEALLAVERAYELSPTDPEVVAPSALVFTHSGLYERAISGLRRAVATSPFDLVAWGYLVFAHGCAGNEDQALEGYNIVTRLINDAPEHPSMPFWLQFAAICSLRLDLIHEAENYGRRCFESQPGFVFNQIFLAEALCRLKRVPEAAQVLATIAAYNPVFSFAQFRIVAQKCCRKPEYVAKLCGTIETLGICP